MQPIPETQRPFDHVLTVRHRNLRWEVAHNGITRRLVDWLFSRERAIDHALDIAQELLDAPGRTRVLVRVVGDGAFERVLVKDRAA
jgi:hypothetical protein